MYSFYRYAMHMDNRSNRNHKTFALFYWFFVWEKREQNTKKTFICFFKNYFLKHKKAKKSGLCPHSMSSTQWVVLTVNSTHQVFVYNVWFIPMYYYQILSHCFLSILQNTSTILCIERMSMLNIKRYICSTKLVTLIYPKLTSESASSKSVRMHWFRMHKLLQLTTINKIYITQ